ncbi:MAG TPA: methyltransferase domain-containing protein [Steroidobacteraceae bacterium]|nr:methyltransferase domain-containing protein [Steroidobacteraceae bacterium]
MKTVSTLSCIALLASCLTVTAFAQSPEQRAQCERTYAPKSGQSGKDVVWVPTPDHLVTAMLTIGNTTAADVVYDLGAGDGKIAIAAARDFGARAVGIEYNEKLVRLAECLVKSSGVADKAKVIHGDIFVNDFSEATVVTMYLLPELNARLMPTLLKMRPGTRIVSHSFSMGDWKPDDRTVVRGADYIFLWHVPAKAAGNWTLQASNREPVVLRLEQKYQVLTGTVLDGGKITPIEEGKLRGSEMTLQYNGPNGPTTLTGTITLNQISATASTEQGSTTFAGMRN